MIGIASGEIVGPNLKGKVLPVGADYQMLRTDGVTELDARYVIQMEQGELIYVINLGLRHGPPEAMERLKRGEPVDPALIYFRSVPRFETAAPAYQWLTRHIFVGSGARFPDHVELAIFQVS